jgi:hypothetical protein
MGLEKEEPSSSHIMARRGGAAAAARLDRVLTIVSDRPKK